MSVASGETPLAVLSARRIVLADGPRGQDKQAAFRCAPQGSNDRSTDTKWSAKLALDVIVGPARDLPSRSAHPRQQGAGDGAPCAGQR
jgi:hypothetical protein